LKSGAALLHPAPVLLAVSAALVGANWLMRPERGVVWALELALVAGLAVVFIAAVRRRSGGAIARAIAFAALMLAIALGVRLAAALGGTIHDDLAERATMVVLGAFIVATGNTLPKTLTPLSMLRCDAGRAQAFHRFAGWTWVLAGLAVSAAWLVLPIDAAQTITLVVLPACMLAIAGRAVWLRWSQPAANPAA